MTYRPTKGFVLLVDDQPEFDDHGVIVRRTLGNAYLDYLVAMGSGPGYGPGDRVVLPSPNLGRKIKLEGTVYRLVRATDPVAVVESARPI